MTPDTCSGPGKPDSRKDDMPDKEDSALSQEAIDALLAGGDASSEDEDEHDVDGSAPNAAGGDIFATDDEEDEAAVQQGVESETATATDRAAAGRDLPAHEADSKTKAGASEAANGLINKDVAALTARIESVEKALKQLANLEKQVQSLKKALDSGKELEALRKKISILENGARNTPVFNLYEKITCSSCGTHGAAQVKTRCPSCGKEGWFGRRSPVEPNLRPVEQAIPRLRPVPSAAPKLRAVPRAPSNGRQADQTRSIKRAA